MRGSKLYVGNLGYNVSQEQLKDLFGSYGTVVEVKIIGDKGFGFVEMSSQSEAEEAKKSLDGYNLDGKSLRVDEARPQGGGKGRPTRRY